MKVKMIATGNVEEIAAGFAQRLYEAGQAVFVKDPAKAEVVVRDRLPEEAEESEPERDPSTPLCSTQDDTEAEATTEADAEAKAEADVKAEADIQARGKNAKGRKSK